MSDIPAHWIENILPDDKCTGTIQILEESVDCHGRIYKLLGCKKCGHRRVVKSNMRRQKESPGNQRGGTGASGSA